MKIKLFSLALTLALATAFALFAGCKKQDGATKPDNVDYYTCTMHPSVKSKDPKAKCPMCSMDLTPVKKRQAEGTNAADAASVHAGHTAPMSKAPPDGLPGSGEDKPSEFSVPV